jgi:hypothetical protein
MSKSLPCDRCLNNAHSNYLVCAIHPKGIDGEVCPDFADDGQELWCPDGYRFDQQHQLVKLPVTYETDHVPTLTRAQQYQILMTHPMFTGLCPQCRYEYKGWNQSNWDCLMCGWEAIGLLEK